MRRTAEDAERTRLALLEAALMAFEEKGWRGATFEHVADRAGVTRGALHHHFRSKADLLSEALTWGWSRYGERLLHRDDGISPARLLRDYTELLHQDAIFRALAASTVLVAPQALDDSTGKHAALDEWHALIAAAISTTHDADPQRVASLVLVLLHGLTVTAVTRPSDLPHPDDLGVLIATLGKEVRP